MTMSLPKMRRLSLRSAAAAAMSSGVGDIDIVSPGEQCALDDEADEDRHRDRGEDQPQAQVVLLLFGRHRADLRAAQPITLVAAAFSFGGVSKVWNGAGDGTSHSRPSAPSHGCCGAFSPLPRIIGTTTANRKYTCDSPKPNAPIDATMLKSVNCIG